MLWVKTFHIVFVVSWFATLFYLPRLFVYHAMPGSQEQNTLDTLTLMESKLLKMSYVASALALFFGTWLIVQWMPGLMTVAWMQLKLLAVLAVIFYHIYCIVIARRFAEGRNQRSNVWYRWFNEVPVIFLVVIVAMVVVRPF